MKDNIHHTLVLLALLVLCLPTTAMAFSGSEGAITQADQCSQSEAETTSVSSISIHADKDTATATDPAKITGQITAAESNLCPIVVHVVLVIPSGVNVASTTNVDSGGAGEASGTLTLSPGETAPVAVTAYGTDVGEKLVMADFRYHPAGHPSLERSSTGLQMSLDIKEPKGEASPDTGLRDLIDRIIRLF